MFIWEGGLAHLAKIPVALAEILAKGLASALTLNKHNENFKRIQGMSWGSLYHLKIVAVFIWAGRLANL